MMLGFYLRRARHAGLALVGGDGKPCSVILPLCLRTLIHDFFPIRGNIYNKSVPGIGGARERANIVKH